MLSSLNVEPAKYPRQPNVPEGLFDFCACLACCFTGLAIQETAGLGLYIQMPVSKQLQMKLCSEVGAGGKFRSHDYKQREIDCCLFKLAGDFLYLEFSGPTALGFYFCSAIAALCQGA